MNYEYNIIHLFLAKFQYQYRLNAGVPYYQTYPTTPSLRLFYLVYV